MRSSEEGSNILDVTITKFIHFLSKITFLSEDKRVIGLSLKFLHSFLTEALRERGLIG